MHAEHPWCLTRQAIGEVAHTLCHTATVFAILENLGCHLVTSILV